MERPFTVSFVRDLFVQYEKEKISFSRLVEILNEKALEVQEIWAAGDVKCDLCGETWTAVYVHGTERLECLRCGQMSTFEEIGPAGGE